MTSTNDGKDVKSNQSSGQKGKSYYIELYKSLDARLSSDCDLSSRTQHLCEAWRRVHGLCLHALPATHPHLLSWLQKHTARTILQTEWQSPKSKNEQTSLDEAIDAFIAECDSGVARKDGVSPPWETQLQQRAEWFKRILENPWGHPVLRALLGTQGAKPSDEQILEWLKEERGVMFVTRLRQLVAGKCDDLAMALVTAVMDRVRAATTLVPDNDQAEETKADKPKTPSDQPTFADTLTSEAGFKIDVWELLTDIEFVLLHKGDRHSKCIELAKQTPLRNGYLLVERLQSRMEGRQYSSREKKLWKNAKEVATLVAQVIIARCMVVPACAGVARTALACCARSLVRLLPAAKLPAAAAALAAPAASARHLHALAHAVDAQLQHARCTDMKPFVCELYVRAITAGMNELERHKLKTEKESEARLLEQTLSAWFMQLGALLSASARVHCECALTAFSVHPAPDMYDKIKAAPPLPPVALDPEDAKEETTSEFGSWTTDSRTQSNLVKTSETLNIKHTRNRANVMSTAILTEGEAIGLSPELCQDLAVLLSGPRVKTLSWDMDREVLLENCRVYMERTHGGTRALTTELKYLNLDPACYMHLPEDDDEENDLYYGIEKGYEHLVEIPELEDVWQDPFDAEQTESACSSSMEMTPATVRRKKKTKRLSVSSEEDSGPLSLIAEVKRSEKKKERPHSKERSTKQSSKESKKKTKPKDNSENKEGSRERRKDNPEDKDKKKEKKSRKKKTKSEREEVQVVDMKPGSLSSLIGMKIAKIKIPEGKYKRPTTDTKVPNFITDSDYDSQGKSSLASLNSEGNDPDVLFDGLYCMEDFKSPENDPLADKNALRNSELSVSDGKVAMHTIRRPQVKPQIGQQIRHDQLKPVTPNNIYGPNPNANTSKNILVREEVRKLIEFRRQKSLLEESHLNSISLPSSTTSTASSPHVNHPSPMPTYKSPNAIKRPEFPEPPLITSPKALVVPEIPKMYINKKQTEQIKELKQEVDMLLHAKYSKKPVIQFANKYNSPQPSTYEDAYAQSVMQPERSQPSVQRLPTPAHCQPTNKDEIMQKTFHDFLKELQESINAGTGVNKSASSAKSPPQQRKDIKPISRVIPVVPKNMKVEPGTSSQCAKSAIQTKKVDTQLNTFSRLSYMHKNKHSDLKTNRGAVEALINYQDQALTKALEEQKAAKLKLMQMQGDVVISRVGQAPQNLSTKDEAKVLIRKVDKPTSAIKDHPTLANMLQSNPLHGAIPKNVSKHENQVRTVHHQTEKPRVTTPAPRTVTPAPRILTPAPRILTPAPRILTPAPRSVTPAPVKESALSEKDQNDLLLLLRQQSKLNSRASYMNTDVNKATNNYHYPNSNITTSNYNQTATNRSVIKNYPMEIKNNNTQNYEASTKKTAPIESVQNLYTKTADSKPGKVSKSVPPKKVQNALNNNSQLHLGTSSRNYGTKSNVSQTGETPREEWEDVMDALLKHKTPCRGPNALDMALKKDGYANSSLRNQRIMRTNVVVDAEKKTTENKTQKQVVAKHVMPTVIHKKTNPVHSVGIDSNLKKQPPPIQTEVIKPIHSAVIDASFKRQITPQIPTEVIKIPVQTSYPIKHHIPIPEPPKRHTDVQKKVASDLVKEKDLPNIPNSDYDLLDELMDDELRQEIRELSSDEETYRTPTVNVAQGTKIVSSSKCTIVNKNATAQQEKVQAIDLRCGAKPAQDSRSNIIQTNKQPAKCLNVPKTVIDYRAQAMQGAVPLNSVRNAKQNVYKMPENTTQQIPTPVMQQPNITVANNQTDNQSYNVCQNINTNLINVVDPRNVIITAVPQPVMPNVVLMSPDLVYDPFASVQAQLQTGLCNVSQTPFVVKTTPNITVYQTTQFASPVVNEVIIGNAMTMPMPADVADNITPLSYNQSQQTPTDQQNLITSNIQSMSNKYNQININNMHVEANPERVLDPLPHGGHSEVDSKANLDINCNKNCERKVLSEVQDKQTLNLIEKIEHNITRSPKLLESDKGEGKINVEIDKKREAKPYLENVPKKNIKDVERLRKKRLAILNREVCHRSYAAAIPLGYVPLIKKVQTTPVITKPAPVNKPDFQSSSKNEGSKAVPNNSKIDNEEQDTDSKENESNTPCRRILLRSSNDLKAMIVSSAQDQRNPVGRKTKVRLKNSKTHTEKNVQEKAAPESVDAKVGEDKDSPKRVSKRILNKQAEKKDIQTEVEPIVIQAAPKKTGTKKQKVVHNDETVNNEINNKTINDKVDNTVINDFKVSTDVEVKPIVTPEVSDFGLIDIEDALLGSKISKTPVIKDDAIPKNDEQTDDSSKAILRKKSSNGKKTVKRKKLANTSIIPTPVQDSVVSDAKSSTGGKSSKIVNNTLGATKKSAIPNTKSVTRSSTITSAVNKEPTDITNITPTMQVKIAKTDSESATANKSNTIVVNEASKTLAPSNRTVQPTVQASADSTTIFKTRSSTRNKSTGAKTLDPSNETVISATQTVLDNLTTQNSESSAKMSTTGKDYKASVTVTQKQNNVLMNDKSSDMPTTGVMNKTMATPSNPTEVNSEQFTKNDTEKSINCTTKSSMLSQADSEYDTPRLADKNEANNEVLSTEPDKNRNLLKSNCDYISNDLDKGNSAPSNGIKNNVNKELKSKTQNKIQDTVEKPSKKNGTYNNNEQELSHSTFQSLKDNITIEELNATAPEGNQKCVRIKLPNGKIFKATVFGTMHVSFESLFSDPAMRSALLNNIHDTKRYTVNIKQVSTAPKNDPSKIVDTRIEEINVHSNLNEPIETVTISDDEESPKQNIDNRLSVKTEFGEFKIAPLDENDFSKHQKKLQLKSFIKLTDCKLSGEAQSESSSDSNKTIENIIQNIQSSNEIVITKKTTILSAEIPSLSVTRTSTLDNEKSTAEIARSNAMKEKASSGPTMCKPGPLNKDRPASVNQPLPCHKIESNVIEIDDSSDDSVNLIDTCLNKDESTQRQNIRERSSVPLEKHVESKKAVEDIDQLKSLLLKDLGVNLGMSDKEKPVQPKQVDILNQENQPHQDIKTDPLKDSNINTPPVKLKHCYVKLQNCDDQVAKYEQIKIINQKCTVDLFRCDAEMTTGKCVNSDDELDLSEDFIDIDPVTTETRLTRSGSFSILDELAVYDFENLEDTGKIEHDRSSPVMEVFDMISRLRKPKEAKDECLSVMEVFDIIASFKRSTLAKKEHLENVACYCDWHATKREIHNISKREFLQSRSNINDVPLFYESTFNSSDVEQFATVPTLKALTTKLFENNDILDQLRPYFINNADPMQSPSHKLKRKIFSREDASVANKLLKVVIDAQICEDLQNQSLNDDVSNLSELNVHYNTDDKEIKDNVSNDNTEINHNILNTSGDMSAKVDKNVDVQITQTAIPENSNQGNLNAFGTEVETVQDDVNTFEDIHTKLDSTIQIAQKVKITRDDTTTEQKVLTDQTNEFNEHNKVTKPVVQAHDNGATGSSNASSQEDKEITSHNLMLNNLSNDKNKDDEANTSSTENTSEGKNSLNLNLMAVTKTDENSLTPHDNEVDLRSSVTAIENIKAETNSVNDVEALVLDLITRPVGIIEHSNLNNIVVDRDECEASANISNASKENASQLAIVTNNENSNITMTDESQNSDSQKNESPSVLNESISCTEIKDIKNNTYVNIDNASDAINNIAKQDQSKCMEPVADNVINTNKDTLITNANKDVSECICADTSGNQDKTESEASHFSGTVLSEEELSVESKVEGAIDRLDNINADKSKVLDTTEADGTNSCLSESIQDTKNLNGVSAEAERENIKEETIDRKSDSSTVGNITENKRNDATACDGIPNDESNRQLDDTDSKLLGEVTEIGSDNSDEVSETTNKSHNDAMLHSMVKDQEKPIIHTNHPGIELVTVHDSSLNGCEKLTGTEAALLSEKNEEATIKQTKLVDEHHSQEAEFVNNIDFVEKVIVIGNESDETDDLASLSKSCQNNLIPLTENSAKDLENEKQYMKLINEQGETQTVTVHVLDHGYALKDLFLKESKRESGNLKADKLNNLQIDVNKSKLDNEFIVSGIEYEDPVAGTCYVFPIAEEETRSCETDDMFDETDEIIQVIQEIGEDGTVGNVTLETKEIQPEETYLKLTLPTITYSRNHACRYYKKKRTLKRKMDMSDIRVNEKRYRKSKHIDNPTKSIGAAIIDSAYSREFKNVIDYCSALKFSYSQPFHKEYIDVDEIIRNWPLGTTPYCDDLHGDFEDEILFRDLDNIERKVFNPVDQSLADEISAEYSESDLPSSNVIEPNFNMGFGEGSDRVIQNLEDVGDDSKFSAAILSDVKQPQPFLMSEDKDNINTDQEAISLKTREDQIKQLKRYLTYIQMRDKVRSFFKKTSAELKYECIKQKNERSDKCDLQNFPFDLYNTTDFMEPSPNNVVVQVVQVGQLPVSAAAQNPVTCDPRVTQVSDASPSQCSVDNSPQDDSQPTIKTEYTELTTADLSVPLMQEYAHHNQMLPMESQEQSNMPMTDENIPIETEIKSVVKIELMEEPEEKEEPQETYDHCEPQSLDNNHVNNTDYSFDSNSNAPPTLEAEPDFAIYNSTEKQNIAEAYPPQLEQKQNGAPEKTDQIAHAMNAAGITTASETMANTRAHALVNILSQKLRQGTVGATQSATNSYPKTTAINAMALQQALAQILPPPLNQTNTSENNQQAQNAPVTPQVLHIVQGKNASGSQITLVDNSQQSVINAPNATPVLHIVQNKSGTASATSNGAGPQQTNSFGGLSLVDAGLQQGGNQLLHIVNTGSQKNNNAAGQLLKRVNLLTNLTNVQGSNEQKMVQFVCKSADGKSIQLNAPHQRSMVLRLQPIETPNVQATPKVEGTDISPTTTATNSLAGKDSAANQQEIKSRSVYEENYAKFIQNSSNKTTGSEKSTSLPKFNQAFGKPVFQDGNQNQNDMNTNNSHLSVSTKTEPGECQATDNAINLDHIGQISSPPLLLRKSPAQTSQPQANLVQQLKQTITPMNIQTMHGGVIYTRQIPVNIGGGQTINLITVPSTELVDDSGQKQQPVGGQSEMESSIIKIVPQNQTAPNTEIASEDGSSSMNVSNEGNQNPQPQPVLTQMRIKLPMLSKAPQMVSGARVVRPSFFQIQRNVIGGTNQPVYQQLVLTAAPPLGQQTIRLPQTSRQIKVPTESSAESQMSSSTLEQLREFDMVLEQVKERSSVPPNSSSSTTFPKLHTPSTDTTDGSSASSASTETTQQVLYSIGNNHQPLNVAYVNRKATVTTPTTSTFVRSPDSSGIVDSPTSSTHVQIPHTVTTESSHNDPPTAPKPKVSTKSKSRPKASSNPPNNLKLNTVPPKTSAQKPLEDEQTTQRILYILAEYKEQVENSPDKDKPAPRRRSNPPSNPSGSSKRKKSSSGSRRHGRDLSPIHGEDTCRTMGSEDSSCGTSQGDCNESCLESHSPQDSPRKVVRKLTFEQETPVTTPRPQPQRNVIVADGQTITVARGTAGKPATAVLMPANYILPVSMVKGGQQIAIVTNRGPKLLTVGGGEGGATNALLLQRLIGPAGLKPVLARPGVRHVRLPTAALHNLQAFNLATATTVQPPDSTASPAPAPTPPELVDTRATSSPWTDRDCTDVKPERGSSPEGSEPWNLPSSGDPHDYSYEETVRADNLDRTVLDPIPDRYSPDMEAQRIFDKMFDVESKKSYMGDSPRCAYDIDASDCDDKPYHQVVQKKDGSSHRQHRLTHVSAAALRHKYAILEHELRLQKSLSEECEDLGVDSPSASELFPEAELLFATSPAHDHTQDQGHHSHTPQPTLLSQSGIPQPDLDDQIATDQLLSRSDMHDDQQDLNLGLEDVGIVTVSEDGMQATIALDQEEFARSHPNTTFHSEPEEAEVQPFTLAGLKGRHITSTIFHSNRAPATVLMTAPQTTVISQATADHHQTSSVKYSDIDNMINSLPSSNGNNINLSSVLVKDEGLTRFDSILSDSRELHLSNTASAIVHSAGNATQVIRRVCYDDDKRDNRFLMDEPDALIAGDDAKMIAEDSSRDATLESMAGDVDDDRSSPERHAELFWESNSASERSESRRPLDFSSDSEKCCKSPSYDETNSTDSSGGVHMRLDSVIKDARGIERSGSADGSSADDAPPLRTYPPKRSYHVGDDAERSLSGKTRAGEPSPARRRASGRGVVKRGCHCCNGEPEPRPKKPRPRKPTMDFTAN